MSKTKKISFRKASIPLVENIRKKLNVHFPVGGQLCTICRNVPEKSNCTNKLADGNTDIEEAEVQEDEDVTFHSASTVSELNSSIKDLAPAISPFKFQLRSAVDLVAPSTERYLKRKLDSCVKAVTDFLCESIAPGQGKEVKKRLLESSQEESSQKL